MRKRGREGGRDIPCECSYEGGNGNKGKSVGCEAYQFFLSELDKTKGIY